MIQLSDECLPHVQGSAVNPSFSVSLVKASLAPLLSGRASTVGPCEEVGMVEGERLTLVSLLPAFTKDALLGIFVEGVVQLHTRVAHSS